MVRTPLPCLLAAASAAALFAQPAQAAISMVAMPVAITSALAAATPCPSGPASVAIAGQNQSKAAALLGRPVSQLDLMRQQQAGLVPAAAPQVAGLGSSQPEPGAGAAMLAAPRSTPCGAPLSFAVSRVQPAPGLASSLPAASVQGDFLGSKRLAVRQTHFDKQWNRVRTSGISRRTAAGFDQAWGSADLAALGKVNRWANSAIRYTEDRVLYGRADHWATAGETLQRRAGDCEDIAIVKMQLLAAQGVARESMHLVIARDLARAADHALLVVELDGRRWLLDNVTDQVLDASQAYDYRPILSYSDSRKFLHGY